MLSSAISLAWVACAGSSFCVNSFMFRHVGSFLCLFCFLRLFFLSLCLLFVFPCVIRCLASCSGVMFLSIGLRFLLLCMCLCFAFVLYLLFVCLYFVDKVGANEACSQCSATIIHVLCCFWSSCCLWAFVFLCFFVVVHSFTFMTRQRSSCHRSIRTDAHDRTSAIPNEKFDIEDPKRCRGRRSRHQTNTTPASEFGECVDTSRIVGINICQGTPACSQQEENVRSVPSPAVTTTRNYRPHQGHEHQNNNHSQSRVFGQCVAVILQAGRRGACWRLRLHISVSALVRLVVGVWSLVRHSLPTDCAVVSVAEAAVASAGLPAGGSQCT